MNIAATTPGSPAPARWPKPFQAALAVTVLAFAWPLFQLGAFAGSSELYSYILLVPAISVFLVWWQRDFLPSGSEPSRAWAAVPALVGCGLLTAFVLATEGAMPTEERLALAALAFASFIVADCMFFLDRRLVAALMFPLGFLVFMAPMPGPLADAVELFLQRGSAATADAFFSVAGTPVYYQDLVFRLPGINLRVAPECSGIHSSLVLLMVSLVAGYLFLRSPWRRTLLAVAMVPLALLRNGFRVFVIGELCVHISPDMINSFIHRRGGPIFFALSLVPFFGLLYWLARSERRPARTPPR
ncbi:MAG TPA: exosortase [Candidatus Didemnitutus sp.]|jgi:exosortase C (VPDSG-CTERM-specific)